MKENFNWIDASIHNLKADKITAIEDIDFKIHVYECLKMGEEIKTDASATKLEQIQEIISEFAWKFPESEFVLQPIREVVSRNGKRELRLYAWIRNLCKK